MSVDATRAASSRATEQPGQRVARWRAPGALATVIAAIVVGQGVAVGVQLLAGSGPASRSVVGSVAVVLAYLATLGVVVSVARRGADRLAPATLGIRRTRLGPALGWAAAIYFGVVAVEGLWSALVGGPAGGGVHHHHAADGTAVPILVAGAVVAPIAEEITFRGYLFPALTRSRGPWIGALACALLSARRTRRCIRPRSCRRWRSSGSASACSSGSPARCCRGSSSTASTTRSC
jgi:membrane protease YdiL (CAAX protease family)